MTEEKKGNINPTFNLDDFFTTQEQRKEKLQGKIEELDISLIDSFPNHPFKVVENEDLQKLKESIKDHGVLEPILVRPKDDGRYEIISGHRRKKATELLGIKKIRCIVKNYTYDEAVIFMVDSNLHREKILPSEKAYAYKMKYEALKHQGKTSSPLDTKFDTANEIGKEYSDSRAQVFRYIRLTNLNKELLQMVDNAELKESPSIAFRPAVELSYLTKEEQKLLVEYIGYNDATPSLAQAIKLKELSQKKLLVEETIDNILSEEKPNQIPKIKINESRVRKVLPKNIDNDNIEDYIIKSIEFYTKHQKNRNHER